MRDFCFVDSVNDGFLAQRGVQGHHCKHKKNCRDLYSAYPALSGGSRRWEQGVLPE
jgi:hypothetical protein